MTDRSAIFDKYDSVIDSLMMDLTMIVDDSDSAIGSPVYDESDTLLERMIEDMICLSSIRQSLSDTMI